MLKRLLNKLESFLFRNDPAFQIKEKEKRIRTRLINKLAKDASEYLGREVKRDEILEKGKEYERQTRLHLRGRDRPPACSAPLVDWSACSNCPHHVYGDEK